MASVSEILQVFGENFVRDLGNSLDRKKDASGNLRKSIHFRIKIFSEHYEFNLLMEDYYKWVDEGRPSGKKGPPINPNVLLAWLRKPAVISKLNLRKTAGLTSGKGLKKTLVENKAKSLAYIIGRKISKKGIRPTYFFTNVLEDGRVERLKIDLSNGLKKDVEVQIREIAKEL